MSIDTGARKRAQKAKKIAVTNNLYINPNQYVVTGATPGVDAYSLIMTQINKCKTNGGGSVLLPYIGGYQISQSIVIDFSNILIVLMDDIISTKTTKSTCIQFTGVSNTNRIKNVGIVGVGGKRKIDGNGRNVIGYTYSTADGFYSSLMFRYADNCVAENIWGYNGLVNGIRSFQCSNVLYRNCDGSDSMFDNGLSIDFDPSQTGWVDTDPSTWSNSRIENCRGWNNRSGFGITIYCASGCEIRSCTVWNNGNDDPTLPVSGGGFSYEGDYFTSSNDRRDLRGRISNCVSINNYNAGMFISAYGIKIDKPSVYSVIAPTNRTNTNGEKGAGIIAVGSASVKISDAYIKNTGGPGVMAYASGFSFTANTTIGSTSLVVTSLANGNVIGGHLSGTGLPSILNPSASSSGGPNNIISGPQNGVGTYIMNHPATSTQTGTNINAIFAHEVYFDGVIEYSGTYGVYALGCTAFVVSKSSDIKYSTSHASYFECGGTYLGQGYSYVRFGAARLLQNGGRAIVGSYIGRLIVDVDVSDTNNISNQQAMCYLQNCTEVVVTLHNADSNFKASQLVYMPTGSGRITIRSLTGDQSTSYPPAALVGGTTRSNISQSGSLMTRWVKTSDTTVANTTTPTDLLAAPGNSGLVGAMSAVVGDEISIEASGLISTISSAGNLVFTLNLGSTVLATSTTTPGNSLVGVSWTFRGRIVYRTVGASGSVQIEGSIQFSNGIIGQLDNGGTPVTVDTTISGIVSLKAAWATANAGNSIVAKMGALRERR